MASFNWETARWRSTSKIFAKYVWCDGEETLEHFLWNCPVGRACWLTMDFVGIIYDNEYLQTKDRLQKYGQIFQQLPRPDFIWIKFISTLWRLGKFRNKLNSKPRRGSKSCCIALERKWRKLASVFSMWLGKKSGKKWDGLNQRKVSLKLTWWHLSPWNGNDRDWHCGKRWSRVPQMDSYPNAKGRVWFYSSVLL